MTQHDLSDSERFGATSTNPDPSGDSHGCGSCVASVRTSRRMVLRAAGLTALAGGGLAVVSACSG